ncbi:MAG TPA: hypothetical protein V6D22_12790 [Candidatus Obscuribacterales bacterium]
MEEFRIEDMSLLQLAALAEEFVWGHLSLNDADRERLRQKLIDRFAQVEALNRSTLRNLSSST